VAKNTQKQVKRDSLKGAGAAFGNDMQLLTRKPSQGGEQCGTCKIWRGPLQMIDTLRRDRCQDSDDCLLCLGSLGQRGHSKETGVIMILPKHIAICRETILGISSKECSRIRIASSHRIGSRMFAAKGHLSPSTAYSRTFSRIRVILTKRHQTDQCAEAGAASVLIAIGLLKH
jgi:hypothetical protein